MLHKVYLQVRVSQLYQFIPRFFELNRCNIIKISDLLKIDIELGKIRPTDIRTSIVNFVQVAEDCGTFFDIIMLNNLIVPLPEGANFTGFTLVSGCYLQIPDY
jgi:hypothetical protein